MPLREDYSVARIRPPRGNSFPSAHAANNFAVAAVCAAFFRRWGWLLFLPADSGRLQPGLCGLALAAGCVGFELARFGHRPPGGSRCRGFMAPLGRTLHSRVARETSESAGCVKRFVTLLLFAIAATAARVAVVWFTDPSPSEAYYFLCSQNPAPAYFDGPGGTAAVTGFASLEANSDIVWRVAAPIWALGATFACFGLARSLSGTGRAVCVALLLNALPAFNAAALRVGPELPALTFALLGMLAAWRAFKAKQGETSLVGRRQGCYLAPRRGLPMRRRQSCWA